MTEPRWARQSRSRCRDGADPALAAGLGIAGLAGWLPFAWRAPLEGGETVLVLGATGSVGLVAVQAAKLLGASRVVAAGRDANRLEKAAALGADATVRIGVGGDLVSAFREAVGGRRPDLRLRRRSGASPSAAAVQAAAPWATGSSTSASRRGRPPSSPRAPCAART